MVRSFILPLLNLLPSQRKSSQPASFRSKQEATTDPIASLHLNCCKVFMAFLEVFHVSTCFRMELFRQWRDQSIQAFTLKVIFQMVILGANIFANIAHATCLEMLADIIKCVS